MKIFSKTKTWIGFSSVLALGLFLFAAGCNSDEFLEDNPQGTFGFTEPRNSEDLETIIEGAYYTIGGNGGFRGILNWPILFTAFASDEGWLPDNFINVGDEGRQWYNRDFSNRNFNWISRHWSNGYAVIQSANLVIDFLDGSVENGFDDRNGPEWTPRILGEAYFLRAFTNFQLAKSFGPPPNAAPEAPSIVLREGPPEGGFDNPGLATVSEVYELIVSDMNRAIELLPVEYVEGRDPIAYQDRVTKWGAHFLAAEVYFLMNEFDLAEQNATAVIESGYFEIQEDVLDAWNKNELGAQAPEVVWQYVNYNSNQQRWKPPIIQRVIGYEERHANVVRPNNGQQLALSDVLVENLGWDDPEVAALDKRHNTLYQRIEPGADTRPNLEEIPNLRIWPDKWYQAEHSGWGTASTASLPLMRLPEMYLTRAAIRMMNGDNAGAAADLNMVKERAWAGDPSDFEPVTAAEVNMDMIELERMIELAFEEDRIYYLQAMQENIPPGERIAADPFPFAQVQMPIPQSEADINPNID